MPRHGAITADFDDANAQDQMGLGALREVFRAAMRPESIEHFLEYALARICPVARASFASVYFIEPDSRLLRVVAAYNWPSEWRPWLGELRVRPGSGPTGLAVSERRAIEVPDVFADPAFTEWREVAKELGFRGIIALPLACDGEVRGAATFYFRQAGGFSVQQRDLLGAGTDLMAIADVRASLGTVSKRTLRGLADTEAELERQRILAVEATHARDEFLANVSHELKTPLTVVLGTIDLMIEELGGPLTPAQHEDLALARGASDRLLGLVETLLALSALRRGTLALTVEAFDPRTALHAAVKLAGVPAAGVTLTIDEPPTFMPSMRADREKTTRIVVSLLANALKFTSKGSVRASVDVRAGRVRYVVQDTGIGIPEDALPIVFEEFRQADGSATRKFGGSGLGLTLARGLARLMGGDVTAESTVGKGSRFVVDLPLAVDPPDA